MHWSPSKKGVSSGHISWPSWGSSALGPKILSFEAGFETKAGSSSDVYGTGSSYVYPSVVERQISRSGCQALSSGHLKQAYVSISNNDGQAMHPSIVKKG